MKKKILTNNGNIYIDRIDKDEEGNILFIPEIDLDVLLESEDLKDE